MYVTRRYDFFNAIKHNFVDTNVNVKQGHKYVLKSSKYGQVSRIFAAIFGVSSYYDYETSALSDYSLNVSRSVEHDGKEGYVFEPKFINQKPDLEQYFAKII